MKNLREGEQGVITAMKLNYDAQKKLLTFGLGKGSIITKNYSPNISALYNISINGKSISLRKQDAEKIEVVKYTDQ